MNVANVDVRIHMNSYEFTRQATLQNKSAVLLRQCKKGAQFTVDERGKKEVEMICTCDRYSEEYKCMKSFGDGTRR